MAEYGYSMPYRGTNIQPLPPGYMEAATAPGRMWAQALGNVGQNIGAAIQQYQRNRAEENYLNAKIDAGLAQYAAAGQQGPLPSGATADLGNLVGILGEKNAKKLSEGTATKAEKLAISHALETYGQQELQALNRQAMIEQLQAARDKRLADRQIGELIRYGVNLPTTQEVQVPTTETLQPVGPMPASNTEVQGPPQLSPEYYTALKRYASQAQVPDVGAIQAQIESLRPLTDPTPKGTQIPIAQGGLGGGIYPRPQATIETPQQVASRVSTAGMKIQQLQQQLEDAKLQQAQAMKEMPRPEQFMRGPEQPSSNQPQFMEPIQVQGSRTEQQQIPYQETRQQLAQFAAQQGMRPEAFAAIDTVLQAAGRQKPMQIESQQLPSGAQVIRADGKVEILPPPKPVEGKDLTEGQSNAAGFAARMIYNEKIINDILKTGYKPDSITEFNMMPERFRTSDRKSYTAAKKNWIAANLRKESGAAIADEEYVNADRQYFPQAGDTEKQIKQKEGLRRVAESGMRAAVGRNSDFYINQILEGARPQETQAASGQAQFRLVPGKGIQPIR